MGLEFIINGSDYGLYFNLKVSNGNKIIPLSGSGSGVNGVGIGDGVKSRYLPRLLLTILMSANDDDTVSFKYGEPSEGYARKEGKSYTLPEFKEYLNEYNSRDWIERMLKRGE